MIRLVGLSLSTDAFWKAIYNPLKHKVIGKLVYAEEGGEFLYIFYVMDFVF